MNTHSDYRQVPTDEWRYVVVRVEGTWWPGELLAWRRHDRTWLAEVSYRTRDETQLGALVQYNHVRAQPPTSAGPSGAANGSTLPHTR